MPKHRQLQPATSARAVPSLADAERLATPLLLLALLLAATGAWLPEARTLLVAIALGIAAPAAVVTFRREQRFAAIRESMAQVTLDAAGTDILTGTSNTAAWHAALDHALLSPSSTPVTVLRLAIDAPDVDAADGEELDRLLVVTSVRWQEILRPGDSLARIAPTDFAVLLPSCERRAADRVVERLREAVPETGRCAVGLATWDGEESATAVVRRAAEALDLARERASRDPFTDPDRLAAVEATGLANRESSEEFDAIASSVAWMLATPVVIITLFDESWQHFIGEHGVGEHGGPRHGMAAEDTICRQTVLTGQPLVVSDTDRHPTLRDVPAVRGFGIAACASVPITSADGHVLGSMCAMMLERHPWSGDDVSLLRLTARRVAERLADCAVASPVRV